MEYAEDDGLAVMPQERAAHSMPLRFEALPKSLNGSGSEGPPGLLWSCYPTAGPALFLFDVHPLAPKNEVADVAAV